MRPYKYKNEIDIIGTVGRVEITKENGSEVARFTVHTITKTEDASGALVKEAFFHHVAAVKGKGIAKFPKQGNGIHIKGHLRYRPVLIEYETEIRTIEVAADSLEIKSLLKD